MTAAIKRNKQGDDPQYWLDKYGHIEKLTPLQMMDKLHEDIEHKVWRYNLARLTKILGKSGSWIKGLEAKGQDFYLKTRIGRYAGDLAYYRYISFDSKRHEYMGFDVRTGNNLDKYNSYNREQPRKFARSTIIHDFSPYCSVVISEKEFQKAFASV